MRRVSPTDPPTANPLVTVAVVSWNTRDLLGRCLDSLAEAQSSGFARVVVVDNASSDGSAELVREHYPWVELLETGANLGFGPAVNLVGSRAETDWIAAANADIELMNGSLESLVALGRSRPGYGAIAPRLALPNGETQKSVFTFPRLSTVLLASLGAHRLSQRIAGSMFHGAIADWTRQAEIEWAMGAFLMIRRRAFDDVGGFDERQWMYAEDLDLCWRLSRAGWRVVYTPSITVEHTGGASTVQAFGDSRNTRQVVAAQYAWLRRRRGRPVAWAFAATTLAGASARVAGYFAAATIGIPGARDRLAQSLDWLNLNRVSIGSALRAADPGDRSPAPRTESPA